MGDWPIPHLVRRRSADQASFNNVQTDIVGLAFSILENEEWSVHCTISVQMVGTTGVKFYFTFPAGCIGDVHRMGNVATLPTWQSLYLAALTVPGTFFVTGAIQGRYDLSARILNGATPGTIQLVGITGAAGTTCVVRRGALLKATRIVP